MARTLTVFAELRRIPNKNQKYTVCQHYNKTSVYIPLILLLISPTDTLLYSLKEKRLQNVTLP